MSPIEDRVSALLKAAPGEPPITLDPATLPHGATSRPARRWLLPMLAGAAVVAVAATAGLLMIRTSPPTHPVSSAPAGPRPSRTVASSPPHSPSAAHAEAVALLQSVPLPPRAEHIADRPTTLERGGGTVLSSREAEVTGVWRAPGTVAEALRFARAHAVPGLSPGCTCGSTVKWIAFSDGTGSRAIDYVVAPFRSGVAIKVTAIVAYVPRRPAWSYLAGSVTSVDVTIERIRDFGTTGGAPTVHRTLTGYRLHHLARVANAARPQAPSICRGGVIMVRSTDILVFHEPGRTITFTMLPENCPQFVVQGPGHAVAYLESNDLDEAALAELGLPPDYGQ